MEWTRLLDLSNIPQVVEMYEDATGMNLPPRQPYGGQLVFAAFPALIRMQSPREYSGARAILALIGMFLISRLTRRISDEATKMM